MIGLFFGSFNPIHLGHVSLAKYLQKHTDLKGIWFVVSPQNPLKQNDELLSDELRLELVKMAIKDEPSFDFCDVEFSLPKPNYTIDTLTKLSELYPNREFTLIIGADNLALFESWIGYDAIIANYQVMVYPREGFDLMYLQSKYPQVQVVDAPLYPISSTKIRELIEQEKDASQWLHPLVYKRLLQL